MPWTRHDGLPAELNRLRSKNWASKSGVRSHQSALLLGFRPEPPELSRVLLDVGDDGRSLAMKRGDLRRKGGDAAGSSVCSSDTPKLSFGVKFGYALRLF